MSSQFTLFIEQLDEFIIHTVHHEQYPSNRVNTQLLHTQTQLSFNLPNVLFTNSTFSFTCFII